jgi:hypothetical protein
MKTEAAEMIRAAVALQVAALEWDGDDTTTQASARQAIAAMQECLNVAGHAFAKMKRASERTRHGR